MHRLGLALSGGGFRATLYHLGVVRFLRDAGILRRITHITSVSGGSILGAHLALNWNKYCGSTAEFEEAAQEIIKFVQMDVRNQIVRRFPFASAANSVRSFLRMRPVRQLTRPGLLEKYYERFLYGDVPLSRLPDSPRLHILATNLSEGCLCSFNQHGLMMQRRAPGRRDRFERVHMGLATVPMAVAASSAFPGFFPPLEINGWDVGAEQGEFNRQAFTDGGVYDNLGLRMFRCIERSWVREASPLRREDFLELDAAMVALASASSMPEDTPLRRLRDRLDAHGQQESMLESTRVGNDAADTMIRGLWEIIRSDELYRDECLQNVELSDASSQSLLNYVVETRRQPELDDRLWLNRQIVDSALRQVIGKPCIRLSRKDFDGVLVSDAGGKFKVTRDARAGGLVRTALRSSDILMDRVWQLELEVFENAPGILFFPISDVVTPSQDRSAPDPEIQRQTARIRTDLDRFSDLEISALVQHGYCVARKSCRGRSDDLNVEIPSDPPWDPSATEDAEGRPVSLPGADLNDAVGAVRIARQLRRSSIRRIGSRLLHFRDWPTYVWISMVICLVIGVPYYVFSVNQRARQQRMVLDGIAEMSPNYRTILEYIRRSPTPVFEAMPFKDVETMEQPDFTGFEMLSDARIFDLRAWSDASGKTPATSFSRIRVRRTTEGSDNTHLQYQRETSDENVSIFCGMPSFNPTLTRMRTHNGRYLWELDLDFSRIPIDIPTEIIIQRTLTADMASAAADEGRFNFVVRAKTSLLAVWVLLPDDREHDSFEVSGYPVGKPELAQVVVPHSATRVALGSVATFRLINPDPNFRYECRWKWGR